MRHSEDILGVVKWAASRVFVLRMKAEYENMDHNLDHREEPHHTDSKEGKTGHSCRPALLSWELVWWAHLRHYFFSPPPEKHSLLFHDDMKLPKHQQVIRLSLFLLAHHLNPFTISHIDSRRSDHQCLCWIFVCLSGHFLGCAESFHLNSNRKRGEKKINSSNKSKTIMESIQYVEMPCFKLLWRLQLFSK